MKTLKPFKLLLFCMSALIFTASCKDDKENKIRNKFEWDGTEQAITYAVFAREDNSGGNDNPNEYFVMSTNDYWLKIIVPQQYLGINRYQWPKIRPYTVRFQSKTPGLFSYDMTNESQSPDPRVVGGTFRILPKSYGNYEIDMDINIHNGYSIEVLKVHFNGKMTNDPSINEWEEDNPDIRR